MINRIHIIRESLEKQNAKVNHSTMLMKGTRFYSDNSVLVRLERFDYINDLDGMIRAALIDCMSADYYYKYEKDYGYGF